MMKNTLRNIEYRVPYRVAVERYNQFRPMPSGIGHFHHRFYLELARMLEMSHSDPYWVLDLGTYFGHSAFTFLQGASFVSAHPNLRVLSIDLFRQPDFIYTWPEVQNFIKVYGSSEPEAISTALSELCQKYSLDNTIILHKQDVTTLTPETLSLFSQSPYSAILVDCAKLPVVMQSVVNLIATPDVVRLGTLVFFEDMFDWHAPWNLYAMWHMIIRGNARVAYLGKRVGPLLEVTDFNSMDGLIEYDDVSPIGDAWAKRFADGDSELRAIDHFREMIKDCVELTWKTDCLRVGVLLRAERVSEAEELVSRLDINWPIYLNDNLLQEAYIRMRHFQTGIKDKSLRTPNHMMRAQWRLNRLIQIIRNRWPVF